jgi:uncharacterized protein involved in exopolysaccharide biosynthesis
MATREITKREPRFAEPELDHELILDPAESTGSNSVEFAALLWEHRRFLGRCTGIGFVVSVILALLLPLRYTSTTRLMPPDQTASGMASILTALTDKSGGLAALGGQLMGLKTSGDLFIGVLQSRSVEDDIVNKFDLRTVYGTKSYESARKRLLHSTEVTGDRKSGIITIVVNDEDPKRAAAIGREYVEALNHVVMTLNTSSAHKERVFLESRLGEVQQDLEVAEKEFSQFASKNTALDVKEQGKAMISAAAMLEGQLIATQTQLEGLRQIYTSSNVRVRSLEAQVEEYQHQLGKLNGKTPAEAENGTANGSANGTASNASGDAANGTQKDLYPTIRQLPLLGVAWADLYRRTRVEETVFESLTGQYELAKVQEAREMPSVNVLDPADVPERKSGPPRTMIVLFLTFFVFAAASTWIWARIRWQNIDPADPGKMLTLEIAHTIRRKLSSLRTPGLRKMPTADSTNRDDRGSGLNGPSREE